MNLRETTFSNYEGDCQGRRKLSYLILSSVMLAALAGGLFGQSARNPAENLEVLAGSAEFPSLRQMLPDSLNAVAFRHLADRERAVAQLATRAEIEQRQRRIRETLLRAIGGLPQRTPLNPKLAGTLKRAGYRVEKIIFESVPAFYVPANLYVPESGGPPYPGILLPLGHERGGKANEDWQRLAITFAQNGFVVLTWDPMGQGERVQLYDPELGESKVSWATNEHSLAGTQCLLLGHSLARHRIWDGMRALDYLVSRPEVDPARIGCTGNSGGGTMTAYLSALDDRIQVAAPSCYLTSWKSLLETIGPQDAEQNLPPFLSEGLDQADFVIAFAPKPYLIAAAVQDFFPIAGTRQTFREVNRLYGILGAEERLSIVEANDTHGYSLPRRLAAYRWMNRWLKGADREIAEPEIEIESEADLRCTQTGQVSTSLGGETIFSINLAEALKAKPNRPALSNLADGAELKRFQQELRARVEKLTGFTRVRTGLNARSFGEIARPGYRIEKLAFESEPRIIVPALLFVPAGTSAPRHTILYLHEHGKAADARPGGQIEEMVRAGAMVLAIDLRGLGETREAEVERFSELFGHYESALTALLTGRTLLGLRAQDVVRAVDLLEARGDVELSSLTAYAQGETAAVLLHAAVLDSRIKQVLLEEPLVSYASVVRHKIHRQVLESIVPGALGSYDLPELAASLAPRRLWIVNAVNPRGLPVELPQVKAEYAPAQAAYALAGATGALTIVERKPGQKPVALFPTSARAEKSEQRR